VPLQYLLDEEVNPAVSEAARALDLLIRDFFQAGGPHFGVLVDSSHATEQGPGWPRAGAEAMGYWPPCGSAPGAVHHRLPRRLEGVCGAPPSSPPPLQLPISTARENREEQRADGAGVDPSGLRAGVHVSYTPTTHLGCFGREGPGVGCGVPEGWTHVRPGPVGPAGDRVLAVPGDAQNGRPVCATTSTPESGRPSDSPLSPIPAHPRIPEAPFRLTDLPVLDKR
jgi:hypothetical protein